MSHYPEQPPTGWRALVEREVERERACGEAAWAGWPPAAERATAASPAAVAEPAAGPSTSAGGAVGAAKTTRGPSRASG